MNLHTERAGLHIGGAKEYSGNSNNLRALVQTSVNTVSADKATKSDSATLSRDIKPIAPRDGFVTFTTSALLGDSTFTFPSGRDGQEIRDALIEAGVPFGAHILFENGKAVQVIPSGLTSPPLPVTAKLAALLGQA